MGFRLKNSVDQRDAESDETVRLPDGGTAQINKGDKVYQGENGWVYHHPSEDDEGNPVTPDWSEVAKGHSNPALVADLFEESDSDEADGGPESDSDEGNDDSGDDGPFPPPAAPTPRRRAGDK
jgi:hypothetical protein